MDWALEGEVWWPGGWRLKLWDTWQAGECGGGRGGPPCPSGIIESTPPLLATVLVIYVLQAVTTPKK